MFGLVATTAALMAGSALAGSVGSAIVVNQCSYPVHLCNVPASGGGFSEIDRVLQTGDTYTQQWTELSNTMGWSIKLSKDTSFSDNIMQYEYTYHGDNIIWYDLSEVNGNPWRGNFEITAESQSSCTPRQVAYRFATDDAYGMQDCPADSTITVTLCSGEDSASSNGGSGSANTTPSTPASTPTAAAPTTSTAAPAAYTAPVVAALVNDQSAPSQAQTTTTTPQTPAQQSTPTTLETVTRTEWVTIDTTETAWAHGKRHAARAHHPHHPRH